MPFNPIPRRFSPNLITYFDEPLLHFCSLGYLGKSVERVKIERSLGNDSLLK